MKDTPTPDLIYFAPLLPWHHELWQTLTSKALSNQHSLPHGLLAGGNIGIGKRAFVWRWVAWQLCHNQHNSLDVACGNCKSCQWLKAGTHPDLQVLPVTSLPISNVPNSLDVTSKKTKTPTSVDNTKIAKIKIDDIRNIQNFVQHSSSGVRICVFDFADTMTIAAANALLKTLEEPREGVRIILMSDKPSLLLPTIKSRIQQLPMTKIEPLLIERYVSEKLDCINNLPTTKEQVKQLILLSGNSPLQAIEIARSTWYPLRQLWLKTWQAVKNKSRTTIAASDYWQSKLDINDFITLSQVMLVELIRLSHNLPTYQQDIDFNVISSQTIPHIKSMQNFQLTLHNIKLSQKQNVQDKLAYDMLIQELSYL